ncbi:MAG: hypothetical protein U5K32_14110 [Bacteroidales bacterium]|nr:hypothetical protein [Bacteroidales bacterium]
MKKPQCHRIINATKKILIAAALLLMTSCYSEYLHMNYSQHHGATWNNDHTSVAFIISSTAYRPAKGIAAFPDGGIPEYLMEEVGLYVYKPDRQDLYKVTDFNNLAGFIGTHRSSWNTRLAYTDSLVYVSAQPASDWSFYLESIAKTEEDSTLIYDLKDKYSDPFVYNINTGQKRAVESSVFTTLYNKDRKADFMNVHDMISGIPLSELGLHIKSIYPKSDREYIEETIYLKNTSPVSRRAVIEQIISQLSEKEIRGLLDKMDKYKNKLEGPEKQEYERISKAVYEEIMALLPPAFD